MQCANSACIISFSLNPPSLSVHEVTTIYSNDLTTANSTTKLSCYVSILGCGLGTYSALKQSIEFKLKTRSSMWSNNTPKYTYLSRLQSFTE